MALADHQKTFKGAKGRPRIVSVIDRDDPREFNPADPETVQIEAPRAPAAPLAPALPSTAPMPAPPAPVPAPIPVPLEPLVSVLPVEPVRHARQAIAGKDAGKPLETLEPEETDEEPGEPLETNPPKRKGNAKALAAANAARKAKKEQKSAPTRTKPRRG